MEIHDIELSVPENGTDIQISFGTNVQKPVADAIEESIDDMLQALSKGNSYMLPSSDEDVAEWTMKFMCEETIRANEDDDSFAHLWMYQKVARTVPLDTTWRVDVARFLLVFLAIVDRLPVETAV